MTINQWVRLRGDDSGRRGRVLMFGEPDGDGNYRLVYVRWGKSEVGTHRPEELEVVDDQ